MSDMFGGMATTSRRKKNKTSESGETPPQGPSPSASNSNLSAMENQQSQKDQELKQRLERFYNYYNPSKLDSIDKTVDMFRGNEQKLWEMLGVKYGPEPSEEALAKQKAEQQAKANAASHSVTGKQTQLRRRAHTQVNNNAPEEETTTTTAPTTSEAHAAGTTGEAAGFGGGSDSGFGSTEGGGGDAAAAGWGAAPAAGTGDAGFGFGDGAAATADAGAGWGTTDAGASTGGFGFGGGDDAAAGAGGGGFSFGGAPSGAGDGAAEASSGFGFGGGDADANAAASAEGAGGFGFGGGEGDASAAAGGGFGFGGGGDEQQQEQQTSASHVDPNHNNNHNNNNNNNDSDSDDSDDGIAEKIDKRLTKTLGGLVAKRDAFAALIEELADAVSQRRATLTECAQLEALVDDLTAKEQFDEAEETHGKLLEAAKRVAACDATWLSGSSRLDPLAEDIKTTVGSSSRCFSDERATLVQLRADEERKMKSYVTDATHKVETTASRIKVDLDKAMRAQSHVEQDLEDLRVRKSEIEAKIDEQTKGLRAEKEKITGDANRLGEEIHDLEKLLENKRRQLADKEGQLDDVNHKLDLITRNNAEVMSSVLESMKEEELNLRVCKSRVDDVQEQKKHNEEETSALQQEKKIMEKELDQHSGKIALLERQAQALATEVSIGFNSFFKRVVRATTDVRGKEGKFCLMVPYSVPGAEDDQQATANAASSDEPASPATAAGNALQALKAQHNRLEQQLTLKTEEDSLLMRRLQDIQRAIPQLETAKKQAAAAKQFKEAAAKTTELKSLNEEKEDIDRKSKALQEDIKKMRKDADKVEQQKQQEAKKFRSSMRAFMDKYSATLRAAAVAAETMDPLSLLGVGGMLNASEDGADDAATAEEATKLRAAVKTLIDVLFAELAAVCEVPESQLRSGPSETGSSAGSSPVAQNPPGAMPTNKASSPSLDRVASSPAADEQGDADADDADAAAEGEVPAAEADAAADDDAEPEMSKDDMKAKVEALNAELEAAMEKEEYEQCEQLQGQIDELEAKLAA